MLQKANRIRKTTEYDHIFKEGKSYKTKYFVVIVRKNDVLKDGPKFGFIASKKVGGAIERNRAKRLLREAVRLQLTKFPKNIEVSLIAFNTIDKVSLIEIEHELAKVIEGINLK